MPQIVFLTLFLGLTSGSGAIALQADSAVKSIRIELDGRALATIEHPPWSAQVDFGPSLTPENLVAIGFDEHGVEIARATQTLNLPRRPAEVEVAIRTSDGIPVEAQLVGRHRTHSPLVAPKVTLDGGDLPVTSDLRVPLPKLDWSHLHILSAEARFEDGQVARREVVLNAGTGEAVSSELTPIAVTTDSKDDSTLDGCFSVGGHPIHAAAVEKAPAVVVVVKDPDAREAIASLHPIRVDPVAGWWEQNALRWELMLDRDTAQHVIWPISNKFSAADEPTYDLFGFSNDVPARAGGILWLLTRSRIPLPPKQQPRRFADAVAVAGVDAIASGKRRAVVLLLTRTPDASRHKPAAVRHYLQDIGVPLFVWSAGSAPAAAKEWGEVEDIASSSSITKAVERLKSTLAAQRIAWVAADPLSALRVQAHAHCGVKPLAQRSVAPDR